MSFGDEINTLSSIFDSSHVKENTVAIMFRTNKYNLSLSMFAFELLMDFLRESKLFIFIKIINQFIRVKGITQNVKITLLVVSDGSNIEIAGISASESTKKCDIVSGACIIDQRIEAEVFRRLKQDLHKSAPSKVYVNFNFVRVKNKFR